MSALKVAVIIIVVLAYLALWALVAVGSATDAHQRQGRRRE